MNSIRIYIFILTLFTIARCKDEAVDLVDYNLTIFFVNDQHGQIDNFSKVKHIVDGAKKETDVIVACSGDIFSGNPVVDYYAEKGYPIIDIMNQVGFDITAFGNHEFDYGQNVLTDRINQSDFEWVCANVNMENTGIPQPYEYKTLIVGDLKVTFLGLLETNGKPDATIPSTHPLRVQGISFERPENVLSQYINIKEQENSDVYIALTHIGHDGYNGVLGDFQLAQDYPFFDLIIGGHSSELIDATVNGIPIYQAGKYLDYLGKIELYVEDKSVKNYDFELIDLNTYQDFDTELQTDIDEYNENMDGLLNEVIGTSMTFHDRTQIGCFYTDALRERLDVDVTFQNFGGIRSGLVDGEITVREIYEIDPFNNGAMIYQMSVAEIEDFLKGMQNSFCYSGIQVDRIGDDVQVSDLNGEVIFDETMLSVGINDYIPAVYDSYFPTEVDVQPFTTAEAIIYYLKNIQNEVDYPDCDRYFKYN
jgi:2',3'-cyclic-nucleotide 2'-phosphodiesterase (5'-nucleotidase family)